jgi:peptidoglycan hydrolase-like protein with peptidoglycan-binding domain
MTTRSSMPASSSAAVPRPAFTDEGSVVQPNRSSRRRYKTPAIIAGSAVIAAVLAAVVIGATADPGPRADTSAPVLTVAVTTGSMVSATNARATLHYSQERPLLAAPGGVVTALPGAGTIVATGGTLYRVNNLPVLLLRGSLPAWRTFESGMSPGEDVRQLEENLAALGVFSGPADATFSWATATAISSWQKSLGVERTGTLDRTAVLFSDHDLRVAQTTVSLGAEVAPGTELYKASATAKIVDLDLRLADQNLAVVGSSVSIVLPDGTTTAGSVATVGEPLERPSDGDAAPDGSSATGGTFAVPVTVTLADQTTVGAFSRASVTVQFSSPLADDVLTVPVEALIATDANTFAVETPSKSAEKAVRSIPVTIGAFASGQVQISGEGIREGLEVVVPES